VEDEEVVVVGTIPCPTRDKKNDEQREKEPIVYQQRRTKKQGEQPQPEQVEASVPILSLDSFPSSSPPINGNNPSILEHVELPLAQRRDPRVNARKPPPCYGFEMTLLSLVSHLHIEHLLHLYKQCLSQRIGGGLSRIQGGKMQ
jgi:hypothetical protein